MAPKIFVLDTNVILHEPRAVTRFADNDVVLPIYVIEELDRFKRDMSELGRNAREFARWLDTLRSEGRLTDGVRLPGGGILRVAFAQRREVAEAAFVTPLEYDNLILATAIEQRDLYPQQQVVFVTQDTNLRIRADAVGLYAEDYDPRVMEVSQLYEGQRTIALSAEEIQRAFDGGLPLPEGHDYFDNECVILRDEAKENHTALARVNARAQTVRALPRFKNTISGLTPRNREQSFALDLLLDPEVQLVTLVGKAGTGKTLLALAAGLQMVTQSATYLRMLVSRPVFPLGRDIGFLPGTVEEKLDPWMKPIYDNMELLLGLSEQRTGGSQGRRGPVSVQSLMEMGVLEIEPLTYIRGRSIPNQYLLVDEAQNLTPHEVKTILTRAGEGTKVVFTGDPYQIDNPYIDTTNNGLVYLMGKFRGQAIAGAVSLTKGERSPLAELAANLL